MRLLIATVLDTARILLLFPDWVLKIGLPSLAQSALVVAGGIPKLGQLLILSSIYLAPSFGEVHEKLENDDRPSSNNAVRLLSLHQVRKVVHLSEP